jgi:hypothetical protein
MRGGEERTGKACTPNDHARRVELILFTRPADYCAIVLELVGHKQHVARHAIYEFV